MMEYHAELRNAEWRESDNAKWLVGFIYGDKKGRFEDGERVKTSPVEKTWPGDVFQTRSHTYYKVTSWAESEAGEGGNRG